MRTSALVLLSLLAACATTQAPADEPDTTTYLMQHQSAAEIAPILEEVLGSRCSKVRAPDAEQPRPTGGPAIEPVAELHVRADPRRNALLLRGTPTRVHEALELARRLDVDVTPSDAR